MSSPATCIDLLRERYRGAASAFAVLETIAPDMVTLLEAGIERVPIEQQLNAEPPLSADAVTQLERDVQAFERSFAQLDRKIPSRWFRKNCDLTASNAAGYADYCRILARNLTGPSDASRIERVRFIFHGIAEVVGPIALATREPRRELAAQVLPPSSLGAELVRQTVLHLSTAAARIAGFERLEELLVSDFIVEERGYVVALGEKALDPGIMVAVLELESAIDDTVQRLARAEARDAAQLREHLADAARRLDDVSGRMTDDESSTEQGFEAFQSRRAAWLAMKAEEARKVARAERRRKEREQWDPPKRRWPTALFVALLAGIVWLRLPSGPNERVLSADEVAAFSPVLQTVSLGR